MSFLEEVFLGTKYDAYKHIVERYEEQGHCVVSFLYFANLMQGRLLETPVESWQVSYKKALEKSDVLLPDGIALQLFYRRGAVGRKAGTMPHNLNGTDFNPRMLRKILAEKSVHLGIYTLYDERIGKPKSYIKEVEEAFAEQFGHAFDFIFQAEYAKRMEVDFPRDEYEKSLSQSDAEVNVLLMSTGTPAQEIWSLKHADRIAKNNLLVINAGGTIDYISGFEERAPERVVKARVLETPRRILQNPKKNLKKFLAMFGVVRYWRKKFWLSLAK